MNEAADSRADANHLVHSGAQIYARALVDAGGREVEAPSNGAERASPRVALYSSPPYALSVPALPVPRLAVNLTASRVTGGLEGKRPCSVDARRHSLFLTPAGEPASWRRESPSRHLAIYFRPEMLNAGDDTATEFSCVPTLFNTQVPGLCQVVDDLIAELQTPNLLNGEAADSLGRILLIRVARHLKRAPAASRALTPAGLARLRDYVAAHLSERILVGDLAREVGLSPNRFALAFTQLVRQPPHRFVLAMRIERAARLLAASSSSLAAIAFDCGFASQQHLSNAFRRHLGTTPARYRRGPRPQFSAMN